jgi:hypothetical protein
LRGCKVFGGEVLKMKILSLDTGEIGTWSLRGSERPKLGVENFCWCLLQGSKLVSIGVRHVLEVERTRNAVL